MLTPEQQKRLDELDRLEAAAATSFIPETVSPTPSTTQAGDRNRLLKDQQLVKRAQANGVTAQQQFDNEQNAPLPQKAAQPLVPDSTIFSRFSKRFNESSDQIAKIPTEIEGDSSALMGILKSAIHPETTRALFGQEGVDKQARDFKDLGNTLKKGVLTPLSGLDAVVFSLTGGPLGEAIRKVPPGERQISMTEFEEPLTVNTTPESIEQEASTFEEAVTMLGIPGTGPAVMAIAKGLSKTAGKTEAVQGVLKTLQKDDPRLRKAGAEPFGNEEFDIVLSDKVMKQLNEDAVKALRGAPPSDQRVFLDIADGLEDGTIDPSRISGILNKHDMDANTFVEIFLATGSGAGRTLNRFSATSKALSKAFKADNPELAVKLAKEAKDADFGGKLFRGIQKTDEFRRLAGTSQLVTAIRNATVTPVVAAVGAIDKSFEILLRGSFTKDAWSDALGVIGQAPNAAKQGLPFTGNAQKIFNKLDEVPSSALNVSKKEEFLSNVGIADANIPTGGAADKLGQSRKAFKEGNVLEGTGEALDALGNVTKRGLTVFNRAQEKIMRVGALSLRLAQIKGVKSVDDVDFAKLTQAEIEEAVDFALEVTFAKNPTSQVMKDVLGGLKSIAPLSTAEAPYIRFMFYNAPRWIVNHSPIGAAKVFGPKNLKALANGDTQRTAKILSEAATGSMLISVAAQINRSEASGDRTGEIVREDGSVVPVRSYAPLAPYLLIAKIIEDPSSVQPRDYVELLTSMRTDKDTPSGVLGDVLQAENAEEVEKAVNGLAANYLGMFTVPFRMAKDVVSIFDPEEAIQRDTRNGGILDKAKDNIPFLSQELDPVQSLFEPGPKIQDSPKFLDSIADKVPGNIAPIARQLTGVTINYRPEVEQAVVAAGLNPSRLYPKTGVKEADEFITRVVGELAERNAQLELAGDEYKSQTTKAGQAIYLKAMFAKYKALAKMQMKQEDPQLYLRSQIEANLTELEKQFLDESGFLQNSKLQSPTGLENFIQTGNVEPQPLRVNIHEPKPPVTITPTR